MQLEESKKIPVCFAFTALFLHTLAVVVFKLLFPLLCCGILCNSGQSQRQSDIYQPSVHFAQMGPKVLKLTRAAFSSAGLSGPEAISPFA